MFQVTCKGRTLSELKKSVQAALLELNGEEGSRSVEFKMPATPAIEEEYVDESEISTHIKEDLAPVVQLSGEVDSKGMPYDARIHASSRAKVADGSWRYKRGVDDATIAQIERGVVVQAPQLVAAPVQLPPSIAPSTVAPAIITQTAPPTPPMPQIPSGHTLQTFCANFPMIIGTLVTEGKINQDYVNTLNAHFGVDQIWKLNDEQKSSVFTDFVGWGLVKQVG